MELWDDVVKAAYLYPWDMGDKSYIVELGASEYTFGDA